MESSSKRYPHERAVRPAPVVGHEGFALSAFYAQTLEREGIDIRALTKEPFAVQLDTLLPLVEGRDKDREPDKGLHDSDIHNAVFAYLREAVSRKPEQSLYNLFSRVSLTHMDGADTLSIIAELIDAHRKEGNMHEDGHNTISAPWGKAHRAYMEEARALLMRTEQGAQDNLYFINVRARSLAEEVLEHSDGSREKDERLPFEIQRGIYAAFSDRLYIAPEHISQRIAKGDYEEGIAHLDWREDILELGEPVDVYLQEHGLRAAQDPYAVRDYETLMLMRKRVEHDLHIELNRLTIQEQLYLLDYAKHITVENFEHLRQFSLQYGIDGLRTFLTNEYDDEMSEKVLTFAAMTEPETVKDIFAQYAATLDGAETVRANLAHALSDDKTAAPLPAQLFEAYVRRAAHLFFAAEQMALGGFDAMTGYEGETVTDLKEAFYGVKLITDVIADLGTKEGYTYERDTGKTQQGAQSFRVTHKESGDIYGLKFFIRPRVQEVVRKKSSPTGEPFIQRQQARINIELSLDSLPADDALRRAFHSRTEYRTGGKVIEESVVRFGFDIDDSYDPPRLSFDMGRDAWEDETQRRTGDALGRILGRIAPHGHHLVESFSPEFSDPEMFAHIAEMLKRALDRLARSA